MPPARLAAVEAQPFFRRTLARRSVLLALALLLDLLVLGLVACVRVDLRPRPGSVEVLSYHVSLAVGSWQTYFWLGLIVLAQLVLANRALRASLQGPGMIQLYPLDESEGRRFARLTGPELVEMTQELAREMEAGPISRVVVGDRPDPNAYTARVFGLGNVVVLHANLLEILPPAGVRAIVAHEVAHIRRKDSLVFLLTGIPRSFLYLVGALILWKVGVGIFWFQSLYIFLQRVAFLSFVMTAALYVLTRLERLSSLASQQVEHLADATAAGICGPDTMLNALLLLGQRVSALEALARALAGQPYLEGVRITEEQLLGILRRLPPGELDEKKARALASRMYIEYRLAELKETLCVPFSGEQIRDLARSAEAALLERQAEKDRADAEAVKARREQEASEAELEQRLLDWRAYDWDLSGHLDRQELAALVADLRQHPEKMLFRTFLEPDAQWHSHPTARERVLYLYDAFEETSRQRPDLLAEPSGGQPPPGRA